MSNPEDSNAPQVTVEAPQSTIEQELHRVNSILRLEDEQAVRALFTDAQSTIDDFTIAPATTVSEDGDTTTTRTVPIPAVFAVDDAPHEVYLFSATTATPSGHTHTQIGLRFKSDEPDNADILRDMVTITPDGALRVFNDIGIAVINDPKDIEYTRQTIQNIQLANKLAADASAAVEPAENLRSTDTQTATGEALIAPVSTRKMRAYLVKAWFLEVAFDARQIISPGFRESPASRAKRQRADDYRWWLITLDMTGTTPPDNRK